MTVRITFHGPDHVLRVDGQEIPRGEDAEVSAETAERLLAWAAVDVDVHPGAEPVARPQVEQPPRVGIGSGRAAWAEYAIAIGLPITGDMSRDRIITAVDDALNPAEPEPEADAEQEEPSVEFEDTDNHEDEDERSDTRWP